MEFQSDKLTTLLDLASKLSQGKWSIDESDMDFNSPTNNSCKIRGSVTQNGQKCFQIEFTTKDTESHSSPLATCTGFSPAGTLLTEDGWNTVQVNNWHGKMRIEEMTIAFGENKKTFRGILQSLKYELSVDDNADDVQIIRLVYPYKFDIPYSEGAPQTSVFDPCSKVQKFCCSHDDMELTLENNNNKTDLTLLEIRFQKKCSDLQMRVEPIVYSLQFLVGRPLRWSILQIIDGKKTTIDIQTVPENTGKGIRQLPPLEIPLPKPEFANNYQRLFTKCYDYLKENSNDIEFIRCLLLPPQLWMRGFTDYAIILPILVESMLKKYEVEPKQQSEGFVSLIKKIIDLCENEDRSKVSNGDLKMIISRNNDLLSGSVPPKKKIRSLVDSNLVLNGMDETWSTLRNALAHGKTVEISQSTVDKTGTVLTLLRCLIFGKIDYRGKFTHYGERNDSVFHYNSYPIYEWNDEGQIVQYES